MEKETLKKIILEQNTDFHKEENLILREKLKSIDSLKKLPHIIIISGLRRVGKSTLLKQINNKYYPEKKIAYLNFEDEKLFSFEVEKFNYIYECFLQLDESQNVFFFDEIQNLKNWEIAIRRLYEKKIKFYITGSNASMLSKELGTKLTGRHINVNLYPFSFYEFLRFKNIQINKNDLYRTKNLIIIKKQFEEFLKYGGIPEYLEYQNKEIIKQVYNDILYKDILVRNNISDDRTLRELSKYLLSNIGKEFSYNNLKKLFSLGSSNTIKNYITYLEDSYLIFTLEKYDLSLKRQLLNKKKVYAIDSAFVENVSFKFSEDKGRLLENLIFIELKRRGHEIYYYKDQYECDFVIKKGLKIIDAIQVTLNMSDLETRKREINGLVEACKKNKLKKGLILTYDEEALIEESGIKIEIIPVWKWLIESNKLCKYTL